MTPIDVRRMAQTASTTGSRRVPAVKNAGLEVIGSTVVRLDREPGKTVKATCSADTRDAHEWWGVWPRSRTGSSPQRRPHCPPEPADRHPDRTAFASLHAGQDPAVEREHAPPTQCARACRRARPATSRCDEYIRGIGVGFAFEVPRGTSLASGRLARARDAAEITNHQADEQGQHRGLENQAHSMPVLDVSCFVGQHAEDFAVIVSQVHQCVGDDDDARRQCHRVRTERLTLSKQQSINARWPLVRSPRKAAVSARCRSPDTRLGRRAVRPGMPACCR